MQIVRTLVSLHPNLGFTDAVKGKVIECADGNEAIVKIKEDIKAVATCYGVESLLEGREDDDEIDMSDDDFGIFVTNPSAKRPWAMFRNTDEGDTYYWAIVE